MAPVKNNDTLVTIKRPSRIVIFLKENFLLFSIFTAILLGFSIGIGLKNSSLTKEDLLWFMLPGNLFIRSLEMLIVPIVFLSIVEATSSLSAKSNLKVTLICVILSFLTHLLGSLCGLGGVFVVNLLSQKSLIEPEFSVVEKQKTTYDIIADILRNLITKNIFKATTDTEITKYVLKNHTNVRTIQYIEGTNILGILVFALLIGLSSSVLDEKAKAFRDFFKSANEIIVLILNWLIVLAPIGIASLIMEAIIEIDDLGESFKTIGVFTGICVAILILYSLCVVSLLTFIVTRKNPFKYYYYFLDSMLLAFATTSDILCIQKNLVICDTKVKMDPRLSRFTIPFYSTIQADGSSIFLVMACGFLANYNNVTLTPSDFAIIIIMTSILGFCSPPVPSSSIVTLLVILNAIGQPNFNIAIMYTVEWLLDRVRTSVNLYSHCFCAIITYELCKNDLDTIVNEDAIEMTETRITLNSDVGDRVTINESTVNNDNAINTQF